MKKLFVIALILLPAAGWFARQRAQHQALAAEIARLAAETQQAIADTEQANTEKARIESSLAARAQSLAALLQSNRTTLAPVGASAVASEEIPSDEQRYWNDTRGFVWLRKEHLGRLGAEAFTFATPGKRELRPGEQAILREALPIVFKLNAQFPDLHFDGRVMAIPSGPFWDEKIATLELSLDERRKLDASRALADRWMAENERAGYTVAVAAAALLAMNDAERASAQEALTALLQRHHQLERERVQAGVPPPKKAAGLAGDSRTFLVPAFPEEGRFLREEFVSALRVALGVQRADYFLRLAQPRLKADLGEFGQAARTITFGEGPNSNHTIIETGGTGHFRHYGSSAERPDLPAGWEHLIEFNGPDGAPTLRR